MSDQKATAVAPTDKFKFLQHYVRGRQLSLEKSLTGTGLNLDRFLMLAYNAVRTNAELLDCSPGSWLTALQTAATHGLLPDGIHGALVPYAKKVTFQPMYQGLVQRAYQTKMVTKVWAEVVYKEDEFDANLGTDPKIVHKPAPDRGDEKSLIAVYACALVNGETHFTILSRRDVMRHKAVSKAATKAGGPWDKHEAEMWKKTALIVLAKTLPHFHADAMKFAELADATERDDNMDIIDIAPDAPAETEKKEPLQEVKQRLRDTAPKPAETKADDVVPAEREIGADDNDEPLPPADCKHPGLAEVAKNGLLDPDAPAPACQVCGFEMAPSELVAFVKANAPKTAPKLLTAKQTAEKQAACPHTPLIGRVVKPGFAAQCALCDARLEQAAVDKLGPRK